MNVLRNWLRRKQGGEPDRVAAIVARSAASSPITEEAALDEEIPVEVVGHDDAAEITDKEEPALDERRLQVRVYDFWRDLLGPERFPSIEDLDPAKQEDFAPYSVLIDYTAGIDNPAVAYVGDALAEECAVDRETTRINDIPRDTVLGRIASQSAQVFGNEAPVGFEAEFTDRNGVDVPYRGILLPFSSDNETIDFIYGVVNWKDSSSASVSAEDNFPPLPADPRELLDPVRNQTPRSTAVHAPEPEELDQAALLQESTAQPEAPVAEEATDAEVTVEPVPEEAAAAPRDVDRISDCVSAFEAPRPLIPSLDETHQAPVAVVQDPESLDTLLASARASAQAALRDESGSADPLCEALGQAYDFALSAGKSPDDFARLAGDLGLEVKGRAPVGAIIRMVFAGHEPSHMSGYASCMVKARKMGVKRGQLAERLRNEPQSFAA